MSDFLERIRKSCTHISVLSLDAMRVLPEATEQDSGLYFLWLGESLQYIGKSKYLQQRVQFQREGKVIPFDRHSCLVPIPRQHVAEQQFRPTA